MALIFLTAITGIYYARIQGIQTLRSGIINLYQNKAPFYDMLSGASIAFAAFLLIVPGFFTDFIVFLLFVHLTRRLFFVVNEKIICQFERTKQTQNFTFLLPSTFSIFLKKCADLYASITFCITYRPEISIAQNDRLNE